MNNYLGKRWAVCQLAQCHLLQDLFESSRKK
jgi:hypothetical protein